MKTLPNAFAEAEKSSTCGQSERLADRINGYTAELEREAAALRVQVKRLEAYTVRLQRNLNNAKLVNLNLRRQLKKLSSR